MRKLIKTYIIDSLAEHDWIRFTGQNAMHFALELQRQLWSSEMTCYDELPGGREWGSEWQADLAFLSLFWSLFEAWLICSICSARDFLCLGRELEVSGTAFFSWIAGWRCRSHHSARLQQEYDSEDVQREVLALRQLYPYQQRLWQT